MNGQQASIHESNKQILADYFQRIFQENNQNNEAKTFAMESIRAARNKIVPDQVASLLEQDISRNEIKHAISTLKDKKSLGEDGLPADFFQTFIDLLIDPILQVWHESIKHGALPSTINEGLIKLIHKKGPKEDIGNWTPLTMLNNVYKVIAKALALRLSKHMKQWITKEQKGFIKGRYILDSIIASWEGIEHAEKTNQDFIFFKIDFDKAYDRIHWDYILQSLGDMGLGPNFTNMVKTLFGNAKAKVICNGELTEAITLTKSIRQGCPLAPLLYAIAADGLNWLIKDKVIKGELQGITLPNGDQCVHRCLLMIQTF